MPRLPFLQAKKTPTGVGGFFSQLLKLADYALDHLINQRDKLIQAKCELNRQKNNFHVASPRLDSFFLCPYWDSFIVGTGSTPVQSPREVSVIL